MYVFDDTMLLHSTRSFLAVPAGASFYSIDRSARKALQTTSIQETFFLECWLTNDDLAIGTDTTVCYWSVWGGNSTLVSERQPALSYSQIISYELDKSDKWQIIIGILQKPYHS